MPVFTVQIFKNLLTDPSREWTNVYHLFAANIDEATTFADTLRAMEVAIHQGAVNLSRMRVSTTAEGDNQFAIVPINTVGAGGTSDNLPLFNTVRIDIETGAGGRPDRKYYRTPIPEGNQTNGVLQTAYLDGIAGAVQDAIDTLNAEVNVLIAADTAGWLTATGFPTVQMRQLHRKRRRSTAP